MTLAGIQFFYGRQKLTLYLLVDGFRPSPE